VQVLLQDWFTAFCTYNHNKEYYLVAMAITLFLPSLTTSDQGYHVPNLAFTTALCSSHELDEYFLFSIYPQFLVLLLLCSIVGIIDASTLHNSDHPLLYYHKL